MLIEDPTDNVNYLYSFYKDNSQHARVVPAKAGQKIPVSMELNFDVIATKDWSIVAWGSKGGAITVTHAEGRKSDTLPFIEKRSEVKPDPVLPPTPTPTPTPTPKPDKDPLPPAPKPDDEKDRFMNFVENLEESRCFNWHQFTELDDDSPELRL